VIADDLLELDPAGADPALQPIGEAFMVGRTVRLGYGLVRGVPDQDVPKPEGLLMCEAAGINQDEVLPGKAGETCIQIRSRCRAGQLVDRSVIEDLADDRGRPEHGALLG
jgi:hypothetical protein